MLTRIGAFALSSLLLAPALARGDWPTIPAEALEVTPTAVRFMSVEDGAGGAYFIWYDGLELRALRVDAGGTAAAAWPSAGVLVATTSTLVGLAPAFDPSGGMYVAWATSAFQTDIWLQHLDATGAVVTGWPAGGWQFTSGSGSAAVSLAPDGAGGVYAVWRKSVGIGATRIQADGALSPGWPANGKVVLGNVSSYAFAPDGQGGCYFASIGADRVRVDRRDPGGTLVAAWTSDLMNSTGGDYELRTAADGAGGVVVGWSWTLQQGTAPQTGLTRLMANGLPAAGWPTGGAWVSPSTGSVGCLRQLRVDSQGSIFPASTYSGVTRTWRFTPDGVTATGWPAAGVMLSGPAGYCSGTDLLRIQPDDAGGLYYAFVGTSSVSDVRVGRIDGASATIASGWPANGLVVRSNALTRFDLNLIPDGAGGVIASWRSRVNQTQPAPAEANHVNPDGTLGPAQNTGVGPGGSPAGLALGLPHPNPARSTIAFVLELPHRAAVSLAVFDLQGRLVARIAGGEALEAGVHRFDWKLHDRAGARVAPGLYRVRAAAGGAAVTRGVVIMD